MNRKIMRSASLLIIITAVLMCVVSCGGKKSSSESKKPTTTAATVQQTEEQTEIESAAEKVSETETAAPTEAATKGKSKKEKKQKSTKSAQPTTTAAPTTETFTEMQEDGSYVEYHFRSQKLLNQHFEKHGAEFKDDFGYKTAAEYEKGASDVINDPDALFKHEAEDGDEVYYLEDTNEFVILSTDGYIRTYFRPSGGKKYFDKQ